MSTKRGWPRPLPVVNAFKADLWPLRGAFVKALAVTFSAVVANALAPWPLKWIIDGLIDPGSTRDLVGPIVQLGPAVGIAALGAVFLGLALISAVAESADGVMAARLRERLSFSLRDRVLQHVHTLPPTIRTTHRSGELVLRVVGDVDQVTRFWTKTCPLLARTTATLVVTIGGMAWLSPWMGVACLAVLPGLWLLVRWHAQRLAETAREKRRREGELAGVAQEIVRGLPVIQALSAGEGARQRFAVASAAGLRAGVTAARAAAAFERSFEIARAVVTAGVTVGGALLVLWGWMTVGELTVACAYIAQLVRPIDKLNGLTESVTRGMVAGERLRRLLEERPTVTDVAAPIELTRAHGRIELHDVWFRYPSSDDRRPHVLCGVDLRLEPGQLTVLQGTSGAGKSTLISLLLRLFDPTHGEITLDGHPVRSVSLRSLRTQFAVMTQDLHLFAGTLRQALAINDQIVEQDRIWSALGLVALDEFVRGLPAGLETRVGEDGVNLSGGQRQRLSLARAFLLDRPILLLDEPLANVDAESAAVILEALRRVRQRKTCFAITHESTLASHADVVYRLAQGRVALQPRRCDVAELAR